MRLALLEATRAQTEALRTARTVERPASFYGATKRAGELMAISYARLYGTPSTGLSVMSATPVS